MTAERLRTIPMFAVIRTGGKQYRVAKDDRIVVERLPGVPGEAVVLTDVLMISEAGKAPDVGTPTLETATVLAEVLEQKRADKIIVFKKRRRKGYRRKAGHRQNVTVLRITDISAAGTKPAEAKRETERPAEAEPEAKENAKPEPEAKENAKPEPEAKENAKPKPEAKAEAKPKAEAKAGAKAKRDAKAGKDAKAAKGSKE